MANSSLRLTTLSLLRNAGFEVVRNGNRRKHEKLRHPDGRVAIVGFKTRDKHLLNKILKSVQLEAKL